ncbi:helicase/secretion neighborhood TadE-like protein [Nocardiopsis flavescens]|uniref:Helicase/secretion neighborhood TadE-like protein n=1 Tax=Nocardiopsis flavescens TaxID=758803 RepID=A0A1M6RX76_9ACTN|nr:Rv3654c family TadE-like protein [Nocardiopsis flavescens]SHK36899.1 helicase/secretion neighborhood TadE-like protein [Nocardiopsis flavescens]
MTPGPRPGPRHTRDTGAAAVHWVAMAVLLWTVALAAVLAATARSDRDRAETAADLAALAAASVAVHGADTACERARLTAEANGASLDTCEISGHTAEVVVAVPSVLDLTAGAHSRAGTVHGTLPEEEP